MKGSWKDHLLTVLIEASGEKKGKSIYHKYHNAFHTSYHEDTTQEMAVNDILQLETLSEKKPLDVILYQTEEKNKTTLHLRLYQLGEALPLSDILPMLENMDLRTLSERPYVVKLRSTTAWISDFNVEYTKSFVLDLDKIKTIFQAAFLKICAAACENDGFNKLVIGAELHWREITILRAYAKYLHQTGFRFSQKYIEDIFSQHAMIAADLVKLFKIKFSTKKSNERQNNFDKLERKILDALDAIVSLDEDRIMRRFLLLINATLRTNYFQKINDHSKKYLSLKFKSSDVPDLPLPHPLYEIFVCSTRFDGIHLRGAKVARGGIRWSDRREDFRTEILGLMKTQTVKNAVIVPSGAKGGFVLKALPVAASRELVAAELVDCYKNFIRGLLDLTDNIKNGKTQHPKDVVCYDDDDTYLVVAADKGTADFSDVANSISKEYDFWLGDAFASGGSIGYNHKEMGITARGAWESARRHFRELDINLDTDVITVIGIGDMSGDVFGNGMLCSPHLKLIAAFDHRHIFIDPNPNPQKSYQERLRMFKLPTSSWENYNPKLISKGGGVFQRKSKSITLTPEIKKLLDLQVNSLTPSEMVCALLKAPVDLLYNGGIGTFVKASTETNDEVGDKSNEFTRVNGNQLRCRVVCEGGNLGFTQLGRIEYAMGEGLINTDFIDNSAGVDCSDHEVNIKILLDKAVSEGKLTYKKRNMLLAEMQEDVAKDVLFDNYKQALTISLSASRIINNIVLYQNYIKELEANGKIDRYVEFLPDDKNILERKAAGLSFTRPEIAILLEYTKINIKQEILKSTLPEEPFFKKRLEDAFPDKLNKSFKIYMQQHPLHREIIATQLSNQIVNEMGATFVYRIQTETGATIPEIIYAYTISRYIFESWELTTIIDSFGFKITAKLQYELLHQIRHLLNLSTRWFLRGKHLKKDINKTILHFAGPMNELKQLLPEMISGNAKSYLDLLAEQLVSAGISEDLASRIANYRVLYIFLNVIEVATDYKFDLIKTAKVYFETGIKLNFIWFREQIALDTREGHWNNLARLNLRDEIDFLQKSLTLIIMQTSKKEQSIDKMIKHWMHNHSRLLTRWDQVLQMLHGSTSIDYTMFFIALRELYSWLNTSD